MAKEIEAKFINIDKHQVIKNLEKMGAIKIYDERLMRRCVYRLPTNKPGAWARIRDEGDKVTMTYKCVTSQALDGVEEIEIVIDNFDRGRELLKSIGLIEKAYQETRRMRYRIINDNVEFDIDTWPALNPLLEIESDNEDTVKKYADKLGFNWNTAMFGSADFVYAKEYDVTEEWINDQCTLLSFNHLPPELQPSNKRKIA